MCESITYTLWYFCNNYHCKKFFSWKLIKMMRVLARSLNKIYNITYESLPIDNEYEILAHSIKVVYYTHYM